MSRGNFKLTQMLIWWLKSVFSECRWLHIRMVYSSDCPHVVGTREIVLPILRVRSKQAKVLMNFNETWWGMAITLDKLVKPSLGSSKFLIQPAASEQSLLQRYQETWRKWCDDRPVTVLRQKLLEGCSHKRSKWLDWRRWIAVVLDLAFFVSQEILLSAEAWRILSGCTVETRRIYLFARISTSHGSVETGWCLSLSGTNLSFHECSLQVWREWLKEKVLAEKMKREEKRLSFLYAVLITVMLELYQ